MVALATLKRKLSSGRAFANFRGVIFFAQRRIRRLDSRRRAARLLAGMLPKRTFEGPDSSQVAVELEREGFALLDDLVTPELAAEMREHFHRQPVYAPYIPNSPRVLIDEAGQFDSHVLWYDDLAVLSCPHALDIANHPKVLSVMEAVLGCKPTIGYMTAWWSIPTADGIPRHAENFHRDVDDLKFIKLFVYLTNVGTENGPHEYIRGSHGDQRLSRIRRHTDEEIRETFGADRLVSFTGPAGRAFLENTYGMHRGQPVHAGRRLIFQVVYSLLPLVYGPARPYPAAVAAPTATVLDPYINRRYLQQ
jgi:hypothetical protein